MAALHPGVNQDLLFVFFFCEIKLSMLESIHSEMKEAALEALFLKNTEKRAAAM